MKRSDPNFVRQEEKLAALFEACGLVDPYSGTPIRTIEDLLAYVDGLAAESVYLLMTRNRRDGALFDGAKASRRPSAAFSPSREAARAQLEADLLRDVAEISELDSTIHTPRDLTRLDNFGRIREYVAGGCTLLEAYKRASLDDFFTELSGNPDDNN